MRSRHGLLLVPVGDSVGAGDDVVVLPDVANDRFFAYERVLSDLARRYDGATAAPVAAQLEYAWPLPAAPALRPAPLLGLAALLAAGALAGSAIATAWSAGLRARRRPPGRRSDR